MSNSARNEECSSEYSDHLFLISEISQHWLVSFFSCQ